MDLAPQAETSSEVVGAAAPASGGLPPQSALEKHGKSPPASALAARLVDLVGEAQAEGVFFLARGEHEAEEIAHSFAGMMSNAETILLPPWDCLPYDRVSPSRESMGRRASALCAMAEKAEGPRLVVLSPEAALQRILPPADIAEGFTEIQAGTVLDLAEFEARLQACGYVLDERVDEPGEAALMGQVVDVFSPDASRPVRLLLDQTGTITGIRFYDPVTQRTDEPVERVRLAPACELAPQSPEDRAEAAGRGMEERIVASEKALSTVFALMPKAKIIHDAEIEERLRAAIDLCDDARRARDTQKGRKASKEEFYLGWTEWRKLSLKRASAIAVEGLDMLPAFLLDRDPVKAAAEFIGEATEDGFRVAICALSGELDRLGKALTRRLKRKPEAVAGWNALFEAPAGAFLQAELDLAHGFIDRSARLAVLTPLDVYGARLQKSTGRSAVSLTSEPELRIGDVVLHEDHGVAVLRALETIETEGRMQDVVRLEYHEGATLLAPVEEFGRIWRYGAEEDAVSLDRLKGDGWTKRRAEVSAEIAETATKLVALAAERQNARVEPMAPPRGTYARFAARFPYPETPDQTAAIESVLDDLGSGTVMNRLVCGDVGFGKTEVALRAAAVVALNGRQVAVVAPTTVLARQHFETFSRRFEGTGVSVTLLSRGVSTAEAKQAKEGLAAGSVGIVIGTQAIAAKDVRFHDLGLLVIDEEHRFGVKLKEQLRGLSSRLHVLSMSATPIPRTLAGAMVGVQEASLLSNPPARRRPVRTELAPFDPASVKTALLREKRRDGQSFCVVPRIADIEPTAAILAKLVPELSVLTVHGDMDAGTMDDAMMRFAHGEADILLSTNIIETGLDVPRANTILVWRADRFGMAQLHQLRGRVGRGRAQGSACLLTEAEQEVSAETRSRLSTLLAFDRLGSGLAISARDLDLRGAGDLVGEEQAGHMKLIGVSLYQRLLARAVNEKRGEGEELVFEPEITLEMAGSFPADYVSEAIIRLNLYSRLQRLEEQGDIDAFAEEIEDRFGPLPPETQTLLELARLKLAAVEAGIAKLSAGPLALAVEFRHPKTIDWARLERIKDCARSEERLICRRKTEPGENRLETVRALMDALASHQSRKSEASARARKQLEAA